VLTADQTNQLETRLAGYETTTSNQIAVVIVKGLDGRDLAGFSLAIAEKAGLGRKGRDNGVLLFAAIGDKRLRIEVGRGLEGALPDITCGRIIRDDIAPLFQKGRYYDGLDAGIGSIVRAIGGEYRAPGSVNVENPLVMGLVIGLIVVTVCHFLNRALGGVVGGLAGLGLGAFFLGLGGAAMLAVLGAIFGLFAREIFIVALLSRGGRWHSGGGRGGGGFGGFSGGGGSFSGGGASGGW
jgi:uncharacterized protein